MNLIISVAGLVLCLLGLVQAWAGRQMKERTRRYFIAFFMFTYILMDQTERFYMQEAENAKLKVDILMAQIKPHFIYNSLVAIRSYLDEPDKAEEVLDHFAGFLRGSIDVLEETGCIRASR